MAALTKILIANRGEIAVRVIRAATELGIKTVAVYSAADEGTLPVRLADEAISLDGVRAADTYLNQEKLIAALIQSGADALHPGYGFFAENAEFAAAVEAEGATFIGPRPETIATMADKAAARALAVAHGVPVVPGTAPGLSIAKLKKAAKEIGYPVLLKAVAGGSGRGMRVVESAAMLESLAEEAAREAQAAFANDALIMEKFIVEPRHIEVQIFGDGKGKVVHLFDRECSLQRRRQKLIEEAPAPNLNKTLRNKILKAAVAVAKATKYRSAGTVEFIVRGGTKASDEFYFLETNTRIQVEHPVTEMVTGVDLVKLQLAIASGEPLPFSQKDIATAGHAIEYRINAEDTAKEFGPATGEIRYCSRPGGPGVREDGWVEAGERVSPHYDALLAKLIISGASRSEALERSRRALAEYHIEGLPTTLPFHRWVLEQDAFLTSRADVTWVERSYRGEQPQAKLVGPLELAPAPVFKKKK